MTTPSTIHGSFTIERHFPYPPARVFRAWSDPAAKAAWFRGPDEWSRGPGSLDFREGGEERISGGPKGGPVHTCAARYHDIVANRRLVYVYDMYMDDARMSVSVASVEFFPDSGGTRLVFTEHAVFLDGEDGTASREQGTGELLGNLAAHLEQEAAFEIVSSRVFDAPPAALFAAWADPDRLARWWGPKGFRNTHHQFELRPGGEWRLTMHGPDGTDFPNRWTYEEVGPTRIVARQHSHPFILTATFDEDDGGTRLTWLMRFESDAHCRQVRTYAAPANEEMFDRLADELRRG